MNADVRSALDGLYRKHQHLTPALVLKAAKSKTSPLHGQVFDRPAAEAAEAWYLQRAHDLITAYTVVYAAGDDDNPVLRGRKYHAVRLEDGYVYKSTEDVAADPVISEIVLRDMEREWRQMHRRYGHFQEFVSLVRSTLGDTAA